MPRKYGRKAAAARSKAVGDGGTLKSGQAKKAAQRGGLSDDGVVYDPRGRVTGDFRGRVRKQGNANEV